MRVTKTKVPLSDGKNALYIKILDFENDEEYEVIYKKINELILSFMMVNKVLANKNE